MDKPAFDPDKPFEPAKIEASAADKPAFDPNKPFEPAAKEPSSLDNKVPLIGGTPRGYIRGALNTLPAVGAVAGGGAGLVSPLPGGAAIGAGLGAAGGHELSRIGKKYLLDEDQTSGLEHAKETAGEGLGGATAEMGGQVVGKGIQAGANTKLGQKAVGLLGDVGAKIGETFTGVPEQEIKTYAKHADEIKRMSAASDNSTAEAADAVRQKFAGSIDNTRKEMNQQISSTLNGSDKTIKAEPVVEALNKAKDKIDADFYPEARTQIQDLIDKVTKKINPETGEIPINVAHDTKRFLQDKASSAYRAPGDPASIGTEAAKAAKSGGAVLRQAINEAEPAVAQANNKLSELHDIEDNMNMNLIREGKPEAGLLAAGSGGNPRNAKALSKLGEATGTDMQGDAEKLAAMRTFGRPKFTPQDTTGKSTARMGLGAGLGFLVGHAPGAVAGAALTSPAALRAAIDTGKITAEQAGLLLKSPAGRQILGRTTKGLLKGSDDANP